MDFPATPSSYLHPVSNQPRGHARVVRNAVFPRENAAVNNRSNEDREDMPPPIEYTAGYNDIANLHEHRDYAINNYAGVSLDVLTQAQAAPPDPEIGVFGNPSLNAAADPVRAFPDERPHQGPVSNVQVDELLRQLAILYLRDPNSRIAEIHMEPGPGQVRGVRVYIALDLL